MNWVLLAAISFTTFGLFCAFDAVAALESYLTKDLNLSSVEFGLLFTLYSLPNIVLVLFGGILIDNYGTRFCGVLFSVLACVGASIVAFSSQAESYYGLLAGRFLFGMGTESFYVVQNYMLVEHFKNDNLATAMGISGSISRLGSLVSWTLLPKIATTFSFSTAFWAAAIFCYFSLLCMFAYVSIAGKPTISNKNKKAPSLSSFSLKGFPLRYWLWIIIAVSFYAGIVTFRAMGSKCITSKWGYSSEEAASFLSVIDMASLICSPIWGFVVDKFSFKNRILVIGAGNALAFVAYFIFGQTSMDPIYVVVILGIVMSVVPPTVWPLISVLVDQSKGGIATATVAALLNGAIASCIPVAGSLVDTSVTMFAGFLQLIAAISVFTSLYWYVNTTSDKKSI